MSDNVLGHAGEGAHALEQPAARVMDKERADAEVADAVRPCKYCMQPIVAEASVCYHCQRSQKLLRLHLLIDLAGTFSFLTAFALVVLGWLQFQSTKADQISAREALRQATLAARSNEALLEQQKSLVSNINNSFAQLFSDVCDAFEGTFDVNTHSCVLSNGKHIVYGPFLDDPVGTKPSEKTR